MPLILKEGGVLLSSGAGLAGSTDCCCGGGCNGTEATQLNLTISGWTGDGLCTLLFGPGACEGIIRREQSFAFSVLNRLYEMTDLTATDTNVTGSLTLGTLGDYDDPGLHVYTCRQYSGELALPCGDLATTYEVYAIAIVSSMSCCTGVPPLQVCGSGCSGDIPYSIQFQAFQIGAAGTGVCELPAPCPCITTGNQFGCGPCVPVPVITSVRLDNDQPNMPCDELTGSFVGSSLTRFKTGDVAFAGCWGAGGVTPRAILTNPTATVSLS